MRILFRAATLAALTAPSVALAQDVGALPAPASPAVGPPIQRITTASALSTERLGSVLSVRELPDGRVLVNDGARRRLLLMDTTLATVRVVLDSLTQVANTYGTRAGALLPYRGDSSLFIDPASYAMLVLDPEGRIAKVRSVWRVNDVYSVTNSSGAYGWPGVDAQGRIVYRVPARAARPVVMPPPGVPYVPQEPDSAFIVAVDVNTRMVDTLGSIRIPKTALKVRQTVDGRVMFDEVINPLPATDEWAVLSDGTVAFVRELDYHIDYLNPDGSRTSSPKLPYEWQRMTDEDKERMVDSIRTARLKSVTTEYVTSMIRWTNLYGKPYPPGLPVPAGYTPPPGLPKDWTLPPGVRFPTNYVYACAPGTRPAAAPAASALVTGSPAVAGPAVASSGAAACTPAPERSGGNVPPPPVMRQVSVMRASELPDYRPPIPAGGAVRADQDGNLWIRTIPAKPIPGGAVYDIVSRQGEMVRRLQLPPGYALVGFGKGKVVFLSMRDAEGIHLARVRLT